MINRIKIHAALLLAGLLLLGAGTAQAGDIKIALDCPPDLEKCGTYVWSHAFSEHLKAKGLKFVFFQRDALGGEEEKLDMVSQGLLEVSTSDLAKAGQLEPGILGFYLPYLFDSMDHIDRVIYKTDLLAKVNESTTKKGVRVLALVPVGGLIGIANKKKQIAVPGDMKGLRMRALDKTQAKWLEAWGANTVIIPWAEIYNALQTGVADGYLNPPLVPLMFKHTEVLKYFTDARITSSFRVSLCSEKWYSGLSKKDRAIVDEAVLKGDAANRAWQKKVEKNGLDSLRAAGLKVYEPTAQERAQFAQKVRPLYKELVDPKTADKFVAAADSLRK